MLNTCGVSSKQHLQPRPARARRVGIEAAPARLDEEVEQVVLALGGVREHEAARAEAGQRALGGERRQHRADGGVERVAALAQRLGARLRGQLDARLRPRPSWARRVASPSPG